MRPLNKRLAGARRACVVALLAAAVLALSVAPAGAQTFGIDRPVVTGSLTLAQAIQTGLRVSHMVHVAQTEVRAAAAETRAARSQTLPQLSANTYLSYGDAGNILSTTPGVTPANFFSVPSQGFADQNLTLLAPIYTGGSLREQVRAAQARERAATFDVGGAQADLALRVREAYYRTLLDLEMEHSAQDRLNASEELVRTAQALFTAGKGLEASVRRVEAERADAQRGFASAQNDRAKALIDLKAAMGVKLDSEITLADPLAFSPPGGDLAAQLADAARTRPELKAAWERLAAARSQTGATRGAQGPQVYGMAMADGFTSRPLGTREGYTVGLVVSLPLLDAGQRRAATAQARAGEERAEAEWSDLTLRVEAEVRQAWLDVQTATQNYRTAQAALQSAQAAYDVAALRFRNQKGLLVEQLDALAALTQARANLAQSLYDHAAATARLQRAIGRF